MAKKPIHIFNGQASVGIYRAKWSVSLYEKKAVCKIPFVKWYGCNGTLDFCCETIREGARHKQLVRLSKTIERTQKSNSDADCSALTDEALRIVRGEVA